MMFGRQKKPRQLSLIHIVNALQKEKLGDHDFLEEIKLDLEENIPLSQKKVECLKEGIRKLKEIKNVTKLKTDSPGKSLDTKKNIKPQKEKPVKKPWFGNVLGIKKKPRNAKSQPSAKLQNLNNDKQTNERNFLPDAVKLNVAEQLITHDPKNSHKINDGKKRIGVFKFLSKKKKSQKNDDKPAQNEKLDLDTQKLDKNIKDIDDDPKITKKDKPVNVAIHNIDYELPNFDETPELETSAEQTTNKAFNTDANQISEDLPHRFEKSREGGVRQVLDEIGKEKEMLRADIEEIRQLDGIKQLLEELSKEKEQLRTNVEDIKSRFSTKPLVEKYNNIERRLQSTTDVLYSIQSDIYERIKEIRLLRKDLSVIKDDLNSL